MSINNTLPLTGIRVLDLSTYAAAPICSMTLADWGADVIKVESLAGDFMRFFGSTMNCPFKPDDNITFELDNRNKRGISANLKTPDGQRIMNRLLETADVLVTNMRPEALQRLGMDYNSVQNRFPRIIYAYLNGYGDKGPERNKPGFDLAAYFARSGILIEFGEPGAEPLPAVAGFGDHTTGTFLAGGICAALLHRSRTNKGCKVQIALYNAALWNLSLDIASANNTEGGWPKSSRKKPRTALMNTYKTKDERWLMVMAIEYDRYWKVFCDRVILRPELADDPRFVNVFGAFENSEAQAEIIQNEFAKHDLTELKRRLEDADIVYEVSQRWHEIKNDPQALENGYMMEYKLRSGRTDWIVGNPVKFNGENTLVRRSAPLLGEHNTEILTELGYSKDEIENLRSGKIIV
ncbi:MAG: CoA transferase [Dehalococcoidia bacterium]|nr:CoA transferase [Dehalococcoidia bacterium]